MLIKEFLPNPAGKDADGEYIVLLNDGNAAVSLSGWKLKDAGSKTFSLSGYSVAAGKELKLFSKTTKLALNNNGETIQLLDVSGKVAHELSYVGSSQEGRVIYANREITPELREQLFEPLAASALSAAKAISSEVILTGVFSALILALLSAVILNKVHKAKNILELSANAQGNNQKTTDVGWPV